MEDVAALRLAAARSRPVTTADTRVLEVPGPLGALFDGGMRRGSTLVIGSPPGGVSLALALVAAATAEGGWAAAVGLPSLGLLAATELGIELGRLALVPDPGERWPTVVAALLDGMDLLLLGLPGRVRAAEARRLVARARELGTVLVVLESPRSPCWPEAPDIHLSVATVAWDGLGCGHGYLHSRRVEVVANGRRAATRERRATLWLPGPGGQQRGPAGPGGQQRGPAGPGGQQRGPATPDLPAAALVG